LLFGIGLFMTLLALGLAAAACARALAERPRTQEAATRA
jgi:hypothetical protein